MKTTKFIVPVLLAFAVLLGASCTKEKPVEVTREVEVTRVVERVVKETVVVEKSTIVERTVVVTATPRATPTQTPAPTATTAPTPKPTTTTVPIPTATVVVSPAPTATPHDVTGICQVTKDGSSLPDRVVADNETETLGKFKFSTENDSCTIKELAFRVGAGVSSAISSLRLMDANNQVALEIFAETDLSPFDTAFFRGLDIAVPANTSKVLQVYANFADVTRSNSAASGRQVQLTMTHLKYAFGNGVETIDKTPGPGDTNPVSNSTYVFAAYPTFTDATTTTTFRNLVEATFIKFNVGANGGPVALHQLPFKAFILDEGIPGNPHINVLRLFRDGVDITNRVAITNQSGYNLEGSGSVEKWSNTIWVTWDDDEEGVILPDTESTFELRGWAQGFTPSIAYGDSAGFALLDIGDTHPVTRQYIARSNQYVGQDMGKGDGLSPTAGNTSRGTEADIIWSDLSATLHNASTGSDGTADWHNGYLLQSLPLSQGWLSAR